MVLRCMVSYCIVVPLGKKVSIGQQIIKKGGIGPQIKAEFRDKKQWVISQSLASGLDPPVLVLHLILILPHVIIILLHHTPINFTKSLAVKALLGWAFWITNYYDRHKFSVYFPAWQQWWSLSRSKTEMFTFRLVTPAFHTIGASYSFLQKVLAHNVIFILGHTIMPQHRHDELLEIVWLFSLTGRFCPWEGWVKFAGGSPERMRLSPLAPPSLSCYDSIIWHAQLL